MVDQRHERPRNRRAARPRALLVAVVLTWVSACTVDGGVQPDPRCGRMPVDLDQPAEVEVGQSTDHGGFLDLSPDPTSPSPAAIVCGPQGGYHIWTAVRTHNLDRCGATLHLSHRYADGSGPTGDTVLVVDLLPQPDGSALADTLIAPFTPYALGPQSDGRLLVLRAEVTDSTGRIASSERTVLASLDPTTCSD
jgi:hypothetical protein